MSELHSLRVTFARSILPLLWLHLPLAAAAAWLAGSSILFAALGAALIAGAATVPWMLDRTGPATRYATSVAYVSLVALLVQAFSGHHWQIDLHMYFFASLAILAGWCDWRALIASAAVVAVHHLVLNFLLPAAVFPGGADFGRVVLHAVIVVLEVGVLIWLTHSLTRAFESAAAALGEAKRLGAETERMAAEAAALRDRIEQERKAAVNALAQSLEAKVGVVVGALSAAATELQANAENMSAIAEEGGRHALGVSGATDRAGANVQTASAAADALSGAIADVGREMSASAAIAAQAAEQAQRTNTRVAALAHVADRIGDVVKLIQDIASQTNLLALNATIEAARAGEAGKGFAVVANEVKALASQTTRATEDIAAQIAAIQNETNGVVSAIQEIGHTIARVNEVASSITAVVSQQGAAAQHIVRNIGEAIGATSEVAGELGSFTTAAKETGDAADQVLAAATELSQQSERLNHDINDIIAQIRAA
jgi:methyl-accepting chemotaxis protein